ncbi:hypothetical protein BJV82DRAFT_81383 [Fennellomyces sp. T-0311]|nr:hypothetical protein BJV82DRAFT_81383 [Fennellomyces sp. T-0311]
MNRLTVLLFCLSFNSLTLAIRPSASRLGQGCVLLSDTIYCYGGAAYTSNLDDDDDERAPTFADHFALDVRSMSEVQDTSLENWRQLNGDVGPNAFFAMAPLPDQSGYLMHGGWGRHDGRTYMRNQTMVFHVNTESWEMIPSSPTSIDLISQMPGVLGTNDTIWIWGGRIDELADSEDIPEPENIRSFHSQTLMSTRIPFPRGAYPRVGHSAVLARDGQTVFYFGGMNAESEEREMDNDQDGYANATMSDILLFNTANQSWSRRTSVGDVVPSPRAFHTTTQIPDSDDILLYGGRRFGTDLPVDDYVYKYNTQTNQWTQITLSQNGAGPRWGHSAVLRDRSLFILFGANAQGASTSDFYMLDVDHLDWRGRSSGDDGSGTDAGTRGSSSSSGLDGGAIAGIVIGCLAAAAITALIAIALYRRKKRQQSLYEKYGDNPPANKDEMILNDNPGAPPVPPKHGALFRMFLKPDEPTPQDATPAKIKEHKPDSVE